jgi:hypothetical protein
MLPYFMRFMRVRLLGYVLGRERSRLMGHACASLKPVDIMRQEQFAYHTSKSWLGWDPRSDEHDMSRQVGAIGMALCRMT